MQRRNFLYNSGILASAIVVSPSAVWSATDKYNRTALLVIQDTSAGNRDMIHSVINDSSAQPVRELDEGQVSSLVYSSKGFLVTMTNGETWLAEKVIFSSYKKIDMFPLSVNVETENKAIQLRYDAANHKSAPVPEFWAYTSRKFDNGKMKVFINREKHAFLCIS